MMPLPFLPEVDDWYLPQPRAYPQTSDVPAVPPGFAVPQPPPIPPGSAYSPSRNAWRTPDGMIIGAGNFRPLPPDANTIDSNALMGDALYPQTRLRNL